MQKGMTLIEMLIALSIFALVAIISSTILVNISQVEKNTSIEASLYEDARIILSQLVKEIENGVIDYDEYFSVNVVQKNVSSPVFGLYYGVYGGRFYSPGARKAGGAAANPADLGVECSWPDPQGSQPCEVIYTLSTDLNTGANPFTSSSSNPDLSNAFCDKLGTCPTISSKSDYLFLINNAGNLKTILGAQEMGGGEKSLSIVRLVGEDSDQNGIIDRFACDADFTCKVQTGLISLYNNLKLPTKADLNLTPSAGSAFVPLSPSTANIVGLKFDIFPVDDPYKAYAEPKMQLHPTVKITMTVDLSASAKASYAGTFKPIVLSTTVSSGVVGKINSYPPTTDVGWMKSLGLSSTF